MNSRGTITPTPDIDQIINNPYEERNIEFKRTTPWQDITFKAKITKSILGLANIRDGGWIVIGKEKQSDGTHEAVGMTQSDYGSYDSDPVKDFVKDYADPHVHLSILKPEYDQKKFVVIRVEEFEIMPVICKKACDDILHRGKIYTRPRGKAETIEVPSEVEMREIVSMAVEKETRHFYERIYRSGVLQSPTKPSTPTDKESFDKQLEGIL